jgi:hypothetical protein
MSDPPSYDEVLNARPSRASQNEPADGMPLIFRDGPLDIAIESMEAPPAW